MKLELHRNKIKDVDFSSSTKIENGTLFIDGKELADVISDTSDLNVDIVICRPGERVRITNILDIVEPRIKSEGGGQMFPGFWGSFEKAGNGVTKVLEGVAVMNVAAIPRVQEGLIDMNGIGAQYSPFSQTQNVVLCFAPVPDMETAEYDRRIRLAGLKASVYLAQASWQNVPHKTEILELKPDEIGALTHRKLKRIAYICMLQSQGSLRDTYLYGSSVRELAATIIHPNEIMDGAIVSGNYVIPSNRNPTYFHLNNPIIRELYQRHQNDFLFCGVVICNEHSGLEAKEQAVQCAVDIAKNLRADGVIITKEGGGNADTDLMLMCQMCEAEGIRTVVIGNEAAGKDGADPSLAHTVKAAGAFVTTGNNDEPVKLDAVTEVIGQGPLPGITGDLKESLTIPVGRINGATNLLGFNTLSSRAC
ncbi:MAG: glycine/sarcosine/betaine reductase component B subunit [Desulfobacteraceae bacterium]|jgi:glycine reductase